MSHHSIPIRIIKGVSPDERAGQDHLASTPHRVYVGASAVTPSSGSNHTPHPLHPMMTSEREIVTLTRSVSSHSFFPRSSRFFVRGKGSGVRMNFVNPLTTEQKTFQAFTLWCRRGVQRAVRFLSFLFRGIRFIAGLSLQLIRSLFRHCACVVTKGRVFFSRHVTFFHPSPSVPLKDSSLRSSLTPSTEDHQAFPARRRSVFGYARYIRMRELYVYASIVCVIILILQAFSSYVALRTTQGVVLGEATRGMQALLTAHDHFSRSEIEEALHSFILAQSSFERASQRLHALRFSALLSFIPLFQTGQNLIAVGEHASAASEHIVLALKSLDETRDGLASHSSGAVAMALSPQDPDASVSAPLDISILSSPFIIPSASLRSAAMHLHDASRSLQLADEATTRVRADYLPASYRDSFDTLRGVLPPAERLAAYASNALFLGSSFLGDEGSRRLVIIFQNDAELRPTGGFMGSFAYLDTDHGALTSFSVPGGGFYDLKGSMKVRVDAPYPFRLFSPYWQPWNANYFRDFPTSASAVAWFIEKSQGPSIDGIIAVTPVLLETLLRESGPVVLPEYRTVVTAENVRRFLQEQVEEHYDRTLNQPKAIIGVMMPIVLGRLPALIERDPLRFITILSEALDRRDIMMWSPRSEEQMRILAAGWGGETLRTSGDYLSVVHSNIGGGKTDQVMREQWNRTLTFRDDGNAIARLVITRTHQGNPEDPYEKVHNVDYTRVYVPLGSEFISASGFTQPDASLFKYEEGLMTYPALALIQATERYDESHRVTIGEEDGYAVLSGWMMTKVGQSSEVTIEYLLPPSSTASIGRVEAALRVPRRYQLLIQRQPGLNPTLFQDTWVSPEHWGSAKWYQQGGMKSGQTVISTGMLPVDRDIMYQLIWDGA